MLLWAMHPRWSTSNLLRKHINLTRPLCLETGCVLPGRVHVCRPKLTLQRKPIQVVLLCVLESLCAVSVASITAQPPYAISE